MKGSALSVFHFARLWEAEKAVRPSDASRDYRGDTDGRRAGRAGARHRAGRKPCAQFRGKRPERSPQVTIQRPH